MPLSEHFDIQGDSWIFFLPQTLVQAHGGAVPFPDEKVYEPGILFLASALQGLGQALSKTWPSMLRGDGESSDVTMPG